MEATHYLVNPDAPEEGFDVRIDPEPTRFVYLVEGEPFVGDVNRLAEALEHAHYAGFDVGTHVFTFEAGAPVAHAWTTQSTGFDTHDYATTIVSIEFAKDDPEEASYRIDGRA